MLNYQSILSEIESEVNYLKGVGNVAAYIPELANVSQDHFGISLILLNGENHNVGQTHQKFSIQSISKVFSLALAFSIQGEKLWRRVGVEPSGNPFNSIVQLEYEKGIPRNPFVNAGALVTADILVSSYDHPKKEFLEFVRSFCGDNSIDFNEKVAQSEFDCGWKNAALANMLKSHGNLKNTIDEVLDFYVHQCSIEMTCLQLAQSFLPFANQNCEINGEVVLTKSELKRINAIMLSCGFYDESGEFAFSVGLPGKSGVGGGIAAIHPLHYAVATWSPRLNEKGNSVIGMKALELLTTKTGISIF
ncbi:MAG: glutaminase [Cyclobacteriaceae bacterium]